MSNLIRYDEMCRAITEAYAVDEVKDIRDKAIALEAYFRQAKNPEPERKACEIRLRAERRAGQLLQEMEKASGGEQYHASPTGNTMEPVPTLADLGISKGQSSRWQQLAQVPEPQFEAALADPAKPSTNGILRQQKSPPQEPMNPKALWLWGRLRDFERLAVLDEEPHALFTAMTEGMQADVERLLTCIIPWLQTLTSLEVSHDQ